MSEPAFQRKTKHPTKAIQHYKDTVYLYCDGSCKGNPGPGGCGIVLLYNQYRKNFRVYLGPEVTNNIAELEAVRYGLSAIKDKGKPIVVCSDSTYVIGLMTKGWNPKANQEMIAALKEYLKEFPRLSFLQVPGHSLVPENEDADKLASFAARLKMDEGLLKECEVPKSEKINKPKKPGGVPKKKDEYHDPYYTDKGAKELEDPDSEEIRKLVEEEMAYEEFEEADKKKRLNEWGIEEY